MPKIYIGCSGWTFPGWRGTFYPKDLSQKKELEYASRVLSSIEINGTFYSMQKPQTFQRWYDETPEDFVFSVKGPEYITHRQRLKDVSIPLSNFLASGILNLRKKLGPILWQVPPNMILKDDRFEIFLKMLPHDSKAAAKIAKKHSDWMKERSLTKIDENFPIRHAFEFRHPSFMNPDFVRLMRKHGVAIVFAHSGGERAPYFEDVTSDFIYCRMHGQEPKFKNGYTKDVHSWLAERIKLWISGKQPKDAMCILDQAPPKSKKDAFIYFDTEEKIYAPSDALNLKKTLSGIS